MNRIKKKTAVRAVMLYLILTAGLWMFINSYTNSYNRLTGEKIAPAGVTLSGGKASVNLLEHDTEIDLGAFSPDSKIFCAAYIISPDELRTAAYLLRFVTRSDLHIL